MGRGRERVRVCVLGPLWAVRLIYGRRPPDWRACLTFPSVFQGAGAGLKMQVLSWAVSAPFWQREKGPSLWWAEGVMAVASPVGKRHLSSPGPNTVSLGLGQGVLGSVLPIGRFFTKMDEGASPVTCCRNLGTQVTWAHPFMVLTGIGRFYVHRWAQIPHFPSACDPFEGYSPSPVGKPLYYLYFLKGRKTT